MDTSKKEALRQASLKLFSEQGFAATSTAQIARSAGVAEGTLFHHFRSKQGILDQILDGVLELYFEAAEKALNESKTGCEALLALIEARFALADSHRAEFLVLMRDLPATIRKGGNPTEKPWSDKVRLATFHYEVAISRGVADGSLRNLPPAETALILVSLVNGLLRQQFLCPSTGAEVTALRREAISFCTRSLKKERS